jgi:hypothetical protein
MSTRSNGKPAKLLLSARAGGFDLVVSPAAPSSSASSVRYENSSRPCYVRGLEAIIVELAEKID